MSQTKTRQKRSKLRRKKDNLLIAAFVLLGLITLLTSLAFFNSFDLVTNSFRSADLDILLLESNYDLMPPEERSQLIPNKQLPKDPRILNVEQTDAYVFLKVTVPVGRITDVQEDGTRTVKQAQELFRIKTEENQDVTNRETTFNTAPKAPDDREFWVELPSLEEGTDLSGKTRTYVFGYSVYLRQDESTETLFDYVQLKNLIQYEASPDQPLHIEVKAFGIQTDHLNESLQKDIDGQKAIMTREQLTEIYRYIERIE